MLYEMMRPQFQAPQTPRYEVPEGQIGLGIGPRGFGRHLQMGGGMPPARFPQMHTGGPGQQFHQPMSTGGPGQMFHPLQMGGGGQMFPGLAAMYFGGRY